MANIFTDLLKRIKIDYHDYRKELIGNWNLGREAKQIDKAIKRAKFRNLRDNRTYYILKDNRGGISALTRMEINYWTARGMFHNMNYMQLLRASIAIVTSNQTIQEQYNQEQLRKENNHEQSNKRKSGGKSHKSDF